MNILNVIGIIVIAIGVILVYDARPIARKRFGFESQNEGTKSIKIIGFIISLVGSILFAFI